MELLKFTGNIKNFGTMNKSLIPFYLNNDNSEHQCFTDIIKIWNQILLKKIFNNVKHGFKLNYIKLILFSEDTIIIVNDYNNLIIIDIHKCKSLLDIKVKNEILIESSMTKLLNDPNINTAHDLFMSYATSKTNRKKKICYENMFAIKKIKDNINIIKIDIISTSKIPSATGYKYYKFKLLILTEDHKLYYTEIFNTYYININDSCILLISEDVYDYYLFKKAILVKKTIKENEKNELYFLIGIKWLYPSDDLLNNVNKNKNAIIIKKRKNIIKRIHNEYQDHFSIIDIEDNFNTYTLEIPKYFEDHYTNSMFTYKIKKENTIVDRLNISNNMNIKKLLNGILISYRAITTTNFIIRCIIDILTYGYDEQFIIISIVDHIIYWRIMNNTYYIKITNNYLNFILIDGSIITYDILKGDIIIDGSIITYNNSKGNLINNDYNFIYNNNIHYDQLKTNEIPTLHEPYITLDYIIKNKYLNHVLAMLIYHISNKLKKCIPILCWDIIFNYTKEHDFSNILNSTEKQLKRSCEYAFNPENKKQKLK